MKSFDSQSTQNFSNWMCRRDLCVCVCVYVLLAKLQNSDSTLVVIDSLEAVSAAGKSYLQLYCEGEGVGWGEVR